MTTEETALKHLRALLYELPNGQFLCTVNCGKHFCDACDALDAAKEFLDSLDEKEA